MYDKSNRPFSDVDDSPRLSILHLLTGMTCVAAMFAWMQRYPDPLFDSLLTRPNLYNSVFAVIDGISIAGIIWVFWRTPRPSRYLSHPGYFLIVASGTLILCNKITLTFAEAFFSEPNAAGGMGSPIWNANYELAKTIGWTASAVLGTVIFAVSAVSRGKLTVTWRILFVVLALSQLIHAIQVMAFQFISGNLLLGVLDWVSWKDTGFMIVIGLLGLIAIGKDLGKRNWRDWIHWLGVLVFIQMNFGARFLFYLFHDQDK